MNKVVVVEYDLARRLGMNAALSNSGYDTLPFEDKNDAFEWVKGNRDLDLIILGTMPIKDRYAFLDSLQELNYNPKILIRDGSLFRKESTTYQGSVEYISLEESIKKDNLIKQIRSMI